LKRAVPHVQREQRASLSKRIVGSLDSKTASEIYSPLLLLISVRVLDSADEQSAENRSYGYLRPSIDVKGASGLMVKTGEHARRDARVHVPRDSIALTADVDKRSLADLETLRDLSVAAVAARETPSRGSLPHFRVQHDRRSRVFSPPSTVLGHLNGRNEGDFVAYALVVLRHSRISSCKAVDALLMTLTY